MTMKPNKELLRILAQVEMEAIRRQLFPPFGLVGENAFGRAQRRRLQSRIRKIKLRPIRKSEPRQVWLHVATDRRTRMIVGMALSPAHDADVIWRPLYLAAPGAGDLPCRHSGT